MVALERRAGAAKLVWVRYQTKLEGMPLGCIGLAVSKKVESSKFCSEPLKEVECELNGGRAEVEEMVKDAQAPEDDEPLMELLEMKPAEGPLQDTQASVRLNFIARSARGRGWNQEDQVRGRQAANT